MWTDPHIYGHFLSCFISLVIEKYMLYTFKNELGKEEITHEKMLEALRTAEVVYDDINPQVPFYLRLYEAGLFDRMSALFNLEALNRVEAPVSLKEETAFATDKGCSYADVNFKILRSPMDSSFSMDKARIHYQTRVT